MKKFTTFIVIFLLSITALFAQAPEKFTYQAVVRNATNNLVINAPVGVRVNILQGSPTGNAVYSESHVTSSNTNGLVTVNIGGGSVLHGSFTGIDWSDGPYFLKTDIDPNGGNDYSITSTQQLLSVPYALYAKEAANSFSGDYNDLTNAPAIPTVPTNVSAFTNDAGYLTSFTEQQVLSISHDTLFLTGGSFVKLPGGFDGDYNSLTNKPELFSGDYNDLENVPQIPQIPANVSAFNNDAGYITEASCNGINICESIAALQSQVDSLQQSSLLPETQAQLSIVVTTVVSDITATSATCGGNVTSDGGSVVSAKGVCWNTTGNPTISDNHTIDGGGMGAFESNMHGLSMDTTYYVRAYATNSAGTNYGSQVSFTVRENQSWDGTGLNPNDGLPCQGGAMVTDHVGNVYNTMQIGNQCWMRENLRNASGNEHFSVTDLLLSALPPCPNGWHLPSDAEWTTLTDYVSSQSEFQCGGNSSYISKALASETGWDTGGDSCAVGNDPSTNNATGFSAVPASSYGDSSFGHAGYYAYFWSSSQRGDYPNYAYLLKLEYDSANVERHNYLKTNGFSVRCLRD